MNVGQREFLESPAGLEIMAQLDLDFKKMRASVLTLALKPNPVLADIVREAGRWDSLRSLRSRLRS